MTIYTYFALKKDIYNQLIRSCFGLNITYTIEKQKIEILPIILPVDYYMQIIYFPNCSLIIFSLIFIFNIVAYADFLILLHIDYCTDCSSTYLGIADLSKKKL